MIQVYYGNGKGKTSACVGAAIRAAGNDMRVLFVQFLKNGDSGECQVLKELYNIELMLPEDRYILFEPLDSATIERRSKAYSRLIFDTIAERAGEFQMIVLDEVLDILEFGYVNEERFISLLRDLKINTEIVLSGRKISESLADISEYVSNIQEIKHPYYGGAKPRKGIEY